MCAQASILRRQLRVIGAPGTAGVREDEDGFDIIHECLGLAEIGRAGAVLNDEAVDAIRSRLANDTPRAPCDFRHDVSAEALHDLVERAVNRRQRRQRLDQAVTTRDGVTRSGDATITQLRAANLMYRSRSRSYRATAPAMIWSEIAVH
jgi:hypothetical protein